MVRLAWLALALSVGCVHPDARLENNLGEGGAGGDGSGGAPSSSTAGGAGNEPGCGDGELDATAEQCDDGNRAAQDGCNAACQVECTGWLEPNDHHCYLHIQTSANWSEARNGCKQLAPGYDLAGISSQPEHDFLVTQLPAAAGPEIRIWIGGTDTNSRGMFRWVNDEPWGFTAWDAPEPTNSGGVENCIELWNIHDVWNWNDVDCSLTLSTGFLCELTPAGSMP